MPYDRHARLTLSGVLGGLAQPYEIWSMTLNLQGYEVADVGDTNPVVNQEQVDDAWDDVAAFWGRTESRISEHAFLTQVKMGTYGGDNHLDGDVYYATGEVPGGVAGSNPYPPQVSLAVTLQSATRGPQGRGRVYLPLPTLGIGPLDALVNEGQANGVRDSFVTLIDDLNNLPGLDPISNRVCVASGVSGNHRVTSVRVGRALDTIRSRRNALSESYGGSASIA